MRVSESDVLDALRAVREPRLRKGIVELGLVRGIGGLRRGRPSVRVATLEPTLKTRAAVTADITAAVGQLEGVESVQIEVDALTEDEQRAVRDLLPKGNTFNEPGSTTRVLGISSGKGGVGKSSVTVNTAIALTKLGHSTAILDADVYGFSVPRMLGIDEDPITLVDVIVPPVGHGVACISTGFFVGEEQAVIWRGPMLHKALEQFLTDVWWGEPDFLLVDMPPGTGDVALSMAQYLPRAEIFVVTTPQAAAQRVAQRTAAMARKLNLPLRGIIENMSWFTGNDGTRYEIFGAGGGAELAQRLEVPLLAQVPLVPELREGGDVGVPVTVADPDGEAALAFTALAEAIAALGPSRIYRSELKVR